MTAAPHESDDGLEGWLAVKAAAFFAERRERADFEAFDRLMGRLGGEPPPAGDEVA